MRLKALTLKDKNLFRKYLNLEKHALAVYAFENIYIWKKFFDIRWAVIDDSLCVFFRDAIGCFLYLPPLARKVNPAVIEQVFRVMSVENKNPSLAHIENIEERDVALYQSLSYEVKERSCDYLCRRTDLAFLKGEAFKHKRAASNHFTKHYCYEYFPYADRFAEDCLSLHEYWKKQRMQDHMDPLYRGMLEDSGLSFKSFLDNYAHFNCVGRIVKVDGRVCGFSFGYPLNSQTFCILFEITDLSIKGLAQFIFRQFCSELKDYTYINIMDDSGLENLKKVKLSYRPIKLIPSYTARKKHDQAYR